MANLIASFYCDAGASEKALAVLAALPPNHHLLDEARALLDRGSLFHLSEGAVENGVLGLTITPCDELMALVARAEAGMDG